MSAVPNALSALRALLALPLVCALVAGAQSVALAVFALAAVSDVLDDLRTQKGVTTWQRP